MNTIQKQTWDGITRWLIFNEHGSVMLDIYAEPRGEEKIKAYIWSLWVDEWHRGKGLGKSLLGTAEEIARRENMDAVFLDWNKNESEQWVLDWYMKKGYDDVAFNTRPSMVLLKRVFKIKDKH